MSGHVHKRCICPVRRAEADRKVNCPRPHGSWTFVANLPAEGPTPRRQHTKGGFTTKRDAELALRTFLAHRRRRPGRASDQSHCRAVPRRVARRGDAKPGRDRSQQLPDRRALLRPPPAGVLHDDDAAPGPPHQGLPIPAGRRGSLRSAAVGDDRADGPPHAVQSAERRRAFGVLARSPAANVPLPKAVKPSCRCGTALRSRPSMRFAPQDRLYAA